MNFADENNPERYATINCIPLSGDLKAHISKRNREIYETLVNAGFKFECSANVGSFKEASYVLSFRRDDVYPIIRCDLEWRDDEDVRPEISLRSHVRLTDKIFLALDGQYIVDDDITLDNIIRTCNVITTVANKVPKF